MSHCCSKLLRVVTASALLVASVGLLGCKEEDKDTRLFDETGVWTMVQYTIEGGASQDLDSSRENDLLVKFDSKNKLLATASCNVTDGPVINDDLGDGGCRTNTSNAVWYCRCFAYTYSGDEMVWQEFPIGEAPPDEVTPPDDDGDGTDTSGGGGVSTLVYVEEIEGSQDKIFGPVPMGLWESDGVSSSYTLRQKADGVWDNPEYGTGSPVQPSDCASSCSLEDPA